MLTVQLPFLIAWGALFFVPESLQWLLTKDMIKAKTELDRIAYWNNSIISEECALVSDENSLENVNISTNSEHNSPLKLFNTLKMAKKSIIIGYAWITLNIVNYAVLLDSGNLGSTSLYVNFVCIALVDVPAVLINYITLDRIGRKKGTIFPSLVCIVALSVLAWMPGNGNNTMARLSAAMVTRLFSSVSYFAMVTWTIEIYPTAIRSQGMGFAFAMAKVGLIITPWVIKSSKALSATAPQLLLLGLLSIQSGLLPLLPETNGKHLDSKT